MYSCTPPATTNSLILHEGARHTAEEISGHRKKLRKNVERNVRRIDLLIGAGSLVRLRSPTMHLRNLSRTAAAAILLTLFPAVSMRAEEAHVVPLADLHAKVADATRTRQENISKLDKFFADPPASKALGMVHLDGQQVQRAVASLSDDDLARLSARAERAHNDFSAGALNNEQLTYIVIALATAVLVLIIVKAS
jgi:hypothetical protein